MYLHWTEMQNNFKQNINYYRNIVLAETLVGWEEGVIYLLRASRQE